MEKGSQPCNSFLGDRENLTSYLGLACHMNRPPVTSATVPVM